MKKGLKFSEKTKAITNCCVVAVIKQTILPHSQIVLHYVPSIGSTISTVVEYDSDDGVRMVECYP